MIRPLQARADTDHITDALQRLAAAHVTQFITDDPKADLAAFGLQPADLDLWLGRGTNLMAAVHVGKSPTNDATQVYAQSANGWNTVVTTAREPLAPWRGAVNDFRDTRLFELTAPVAEIEVRGAEQFHSAGTRLQRLENRRRKISRGRRQRPAVHQNARQPAHRGICEGCRDRSPIWRPTASPRRSAKSFCARRRATQTPSSRNWPLARRRPTRFLSGAPARISFTP